MWMTHRSLNHRSSRTCNCGHARLEGAGGDDTYNWSGGGITIALRQGDGIDRLQGSGKLAEAGVPRDANVIEFGDNVASDSVRLEWRSAAVGSGQHRVRSK